MAQGKTSIPGVDDGEELELTDVRPLLETSCRQKRTKSFLGKAIALIQNLLSRESIILAVCGAQSNTHLHVDR